MIPELRPYQLDLVGRVRAARSRGARIIVVQAATGAGKTSWACYVAKQAVAKNSRVLFLVHRRKLVDQIASRLEEFEINHGIIMRGERAYGSASVQVASRDTILSRCFRNEWTGLPPADLVILDEFHHAASPQSEYRRILEQYPRATILGLTATPVGPDGAGMGPWAEAIECAAPTSHLVRDGFLLPVKCYAPDRKVGRGGKMKRGIAGDLVESWKEFGENLPTVLFCSRVGHSQDAVAAYLEAGIPAAHVDADTDDATRERVFASLENGSLKVVSNVGIIKEGVDVPCLGCCQLYMEMSGRVGFLQACGRIMRPHEGQTHGVLIDHAGVVFRHGFPDEDTVWTLTGNADEKFKEKHDKGLTESVNYCKKCEMLFKTPTCPSCGKMPTKPPRSIFAPPPLERTNELITEAERGGDRAAFSKDEKIKHWMRCLGVAARKNGTFAMASVIFKQKYNEWPDKDFPCQAGYGQNKAKVADVYPGFARGKKNEQHGDAYEGE
jgi:DNA repair protein RadD